MKKILSNKWIKTLCLLIVFQTINAKTYNGKDVFGTRTFIENKGQFDKLFVTNDPIKYGIDNGNEQVYFTPKGLVYVLVKRYQNNEALDEENEREAKPNEVYTVHMNWLNANSNIQIIADNKQPHYFTYGGPDKNASCYKKITYINVYDHIDIEYIIPDDKEIGIKYNVIMHKGADPKDIKIAYSGDVSSIFEDNGEMKILTPMEPIVEHTPNSFYKNGSKLNSKFTLTQNVIGFEFPQGYDSNKEVIIDPWVTNVTTLAPSNYGYDVDHDNFGNLYVYGGNNSNKIAKYNNLGLLLWTFPGTISVPAWSSNTYASNFVVHRTTGKSYTGQGFMPGGTQIVRIDASGNYDNLISNAVSTWKEVWDMAYHCSTGSIYGFGGSTSSNESGAIIDQITGSCTPVAFFTIGSTAHDVVSHAIDNTGEIYFLYASVASSAFMNNRIGRINAAFTSSVWLAPTNYNTMQESANKQNYVGGSAASNGFNALAVNSNYLYYYDGFNLSTYNKNTGAQITSTTITGYTARAQGGIAVDDCNNVYLGGNNGDIISYHYTGTSFIPLPSINLNVTTTNKYVYDIKFEKPANLLYVSGSGFVGTFIAANSATCALQPDCNYNILPSNTVICHGAVATVSISNPNNLTNPSYSIQPNGQTQTSPIFTVSPNSTTNYTLFITGTNNQNTTTTNTTVVSVTVVPNPVVTPNVTNGTCANPVTSSVNLNVAFTPSGSANYSVTWSPIPSTVTTANSGTAAGVPPGMTSVTVTTENGCKTTASFSVPPVPQPASFVIVNPSNDYTITCLNPNVVLTTSVTNGVPLTFTWFPNCTNSVVGTSMTFTQACTGQVVGTSSTGCQFVQTFTVYQNLNTPTIVITPTVQNVTCNVASSCFTLYVGPGPNVWSNWYQMVGSNSVIVGVQQGTINIFCPQQPGIYWGIGVDQITGCPITKSVNVTASVGVPIFTVTSSTNYTIGCSSTSVTSLQVPTVITSPVPNVSCQYTFVAPSLNTQTPCPTCFTANPNMNNITTPGTWVVYVMDQTNNCISSQSISIIQNTIAPNVNFIQPLSILTCKDPTMVLTGISSNSNTSITWTVPAIPSNSINPTPNATVVINPAITGATNNITSVGVWTVGAVDNNNLCRSTKTVQVLQDIRLPKFSITAATNSVINCKDPTVLLVPVVANTLAVALIPTYFWIPPVGSGIPGSSYNTTVPGTHTSISTSAVNGCTYSATYNVASDLTPPAISTVGQFTLDCATNPTVSIFPTITGVTTGFTYSWSVPPGALTSNLTSSLLTTNLTGQYMILVTNTINGCAAQAFFEVVGGGINADFTPDPLTGYVPLNVNFTNNSSTSTGASSIISTWGYGNGAVTSTVYNTQMVSTTYTAAGTYSVILKVQKGTCVDTAMRIIKVELASKLEIPNVFTPNGDKSNDIFRLRSTNLSEVYIIIYDRWGTKVYELTSNTGNFAWDGKNQAGKECSDGTYFYILKATGKDDQKYDLRGNVSLFR